MIAGNFDVLVYTMAHQKDLLERFISLNQTYWAGFECIASSLMGFCNSQSTNFVKTSAARLKSGSMILRIILKLPSD